MRKLILLLVVLIGGNLFAASVTGSIGKAATTCLPASSSACVWMALGHNASVATVTITGTWTATLQFEESTDNYDVDSASKTWVSVSAQPIPSGATVTSATSTGSWTIAVPGATYVRVRSSAYTSGTAVVSITSSTANVTIIDNSYPGCTADGSDGITCTGSVASGGFATTSGAPSLWGTCGSAPTLTTGQTALYCDSGTGKFGYKAYGGSFTAFAEGASSVVTLAQTAVQAGDTITGASGTFASTLTVAANTLAAGSVMHCRAGGPYTISSGNDTPTLTFKAGSNTVAAVALPYMDAQTNSPWTWDCTLIARAIGASGTVEGACTTGRPNGGSTAFISWTSTSAVTFGDTTGSLALSLALSSASANATTIMRSFSCVISK